jgi:orotidine-5'-phosphate decarboxylase
MHALKGEFNPEFLYVTPGIKGTTTPAGEDQKRVLSPGRAVAAGSSLLVVGRAITGAADRDAAAREVLSDIANVL